MIAGMNHLLRTVETGGSKSSVFQSSTSPINLQSEIPKSSLPLSDLFLRLIGRNDRIDERHHLTQIGADALEQLVALFRAHRVEPGTARFVLGHPLVCELAFLNFLQHLLHHL